MAKAPGADPELAIVLPLGVLAQQLMRIEAQLRQVNMKALELASESEQRGSGAQISAKLEHISEALDSIRALVSDISRRKPRVEQDD